MIKSSPWAKLLTPLAVVLAVVLVGLAGLLWLNPGGGAAASVSRLIALTEAARAEAPAALAGKPGSMERLAALRGEIGAARGSDAQAGNAAVRQVSAAPEWAAVTAGLDSVLSSRKVLTDAGKTRGDLLELTPKLLNAAGNLMGALPPAKLAANQPQLERFELTVDGMRQSLRELAAGGSAADALKRLGAASEFLGRFLSGLRGEDTSLGLASLKGTASAADIAAAAKLFEQAQAEAGSLVAKREPLAAADEAAARLDSAAAALLQRYRRLEPPTAGPWPFSASPRLPLALASAGLVLLLLIVLAYSRAGDFRRAAEAQAAQNERNQQAILRLLDELSSLADGDLTVQATVTEDITGAIADSINYAIEALRELVATINDSAVMLDAATKQSEGTARQLVRSSEMQAKQVAAASESVTLMAQSIEEVSGNAERCSDVARHAVDVAHKGGEAVRRTIDGMNTIRETIQDTSKRIKRLGESSQEIGNIVELIEEIAEQTNILALNASIEASRAGEGSRGFAVVADEVQKLAERSTNATRKIEVLVRTIQSDTNEAVVSMERSTTDVVGGALLAENAGAALEEIEQVSHQIASLVQNISSSAREQTGVVGEFMKNMNALTGISSKTSEATNATSSSIGKLAELAAQLRRAVSGFALPDPTSGTSVLSPARIAEDAEAPEYAAGAAEPLPSVAAEARRRSG
ncbi:MAG TPA: methyl-accepting chemotaxis protein [Gammaproteobacteria bacterium]|nr:methyl-accepting chemotaxis protein [Gammaproteobacteria bacterium]